MKVVGLDFTTIFDKKIQQSSPIPSGFNKSYDLQGVQFNNVDNGKWIATEEFFFFKFRIFFCCKK